MVRDTWANIEAAVAEAVASGELAAWPPVEDLFDQLLGPLWS